MKAERRPLKAHPAIAVAVIVLCLALLGWEFWGIHLIFFEVLALAALVLGLRYCPPIMRWFSGMPVPHRIVFALIFAVMIKGHFTFDSRRFFPFVPWEIFSNVREVDPVSTREFLAATSAGKSVRLLPEQLFPSIVEFDPPAQNNSALMSRLVHALATEYNRQHPNDPARRVDLVQISIKLHPAADDTSSPPCQLLNSYDVSSDRLN